MRQGHGQQGPSIQEHLVLLDQQPCRRSRSHRRCRRRRLHNTGLQTVVVSAGAGTRRPLVVVVLDAQQIGERNNIVSSQN